jgi:nitrite reductase (NADH) small subunit
VRTTRPYVVDRLESFPPGSLRVLEIEGRSIGVFNVDGRLYAIRNRCPHKGAPMCGWDNGSGLLLSGTMLDSAPHQYEYGCEKSIIRCPWHGYEYKLEDGGSLVDPKLRLKMYQVVIQNGEIVLYL